MNVMGFKAMGHSIQTRFGDLSDLENIVRVINAAFSGAEGFFFDGDRVNRNEVSNLLSKGKFILAEAKGDVIGCVYVEPRGNRAYLGLLSVNPTRQQSGLGSMLMTAAEDYGRSVGCQ